MRKLAIYALMAMVLAAAALPAAAGQLAIGTQFTMPALFGISARYFPGDELGFEGTVFLLSQEGELMGDLAGRVFWRPVRGEGAGFYLAAGGTLVLETYPSPSDIHILHLVAGIEVAMPFAPAVWLNTEFGFVHSEDLALGMAFGVGVHYYFDIGGPAG